MTHILHIDTSGATGMVSIATDGKLVSVRRNGQERDHAAGINNMIAAVLEDAGTSLNDLNAIAVCGGPGSYTGLRIGLATAKGFCYALDIRLILHDRLKMLAWQGIKDVSNAELYISLLPARVDEYFMAVYNKQSRVIVEPGHYSTEQIGKLFESYKGKSITVIGDTSYVKTLSGFQDNILQLDNIQITPKIWGEMSFISWENDEFAHIAKVEPFYLKSVFISKRK